LLRDAESRREELYEVIRA